MDEKYHEQAKENERRQREDGIAKVREAANRRYTPYMLDGEPCCPDCLEPLPEHRLTVGICVPCLARREKQEKRG